MCPRCGHGGRWRTGTGHLMCAGCQYKASVTAGTIFHRSRLQLTSWFAVIWFVCAQKRLFALVQGGSWSEVVGYPPRGAGAPPSSQLS